LNSVPAEIQCARLELKNLLGSKIVMNPVGNGRNGHYVAEVKGKPLNILRPHLHPLMVSSPTGIRTVSDTWVEVKVALSGPARARLHPPSAALAALPRHTSGGVADSQAPTEFENWRIWFKVGVRCHTRDKQDGNGTVDGRRVNWF